MTIHFLFYTDAEITDTTKTSNTEAAINYNKVCYYAAVLR